MIFKAMRDDNARASLISSRKYLWAMMSFLLIFSLAPQTAYAINDITIDGDLSDWADENGLVQDPYQDTNPERTDVTQLGLAVVDNGASPESLALMMVTDTYQDTGNANGDSHKLVFTVGAYEIVVTVQNGCDAVNSVTIDGVASASHSLAISLVTPIYASAGDVTPDCALEIEFPISALPNLDTDMDNELLDESFLTNFVTRQSGGVGNDNDLDDVGGLTPTAVTSLTTNVTHNNNRLSFIMSLAMTLLVLTAGILYYTSYATSNPRQ